jgi:hypothetical protein
MVKIYVGLLVLVIGLTILKNHCREAALDFSLPSTKVSAAGATVPS